MEGKAQKLKYIHKIAQSSLNSWIIYINENKWNLCYSLYHKVAYFLWLDEAIWGKH